MQVKLHTTTVSSTDLRNAKCARDSHDEVLEICFPRRDGAHKYTVITDRRGIILEGSVSFSFGTDPQRHDSADIYRARAPIDPEDSTVVVTVGSDTRIVPLEALRTCKPSPPTYIAELAAEQRLESQSNMASTETYWPLTKSLSEFNMNSRPFTFPPQTHITSGPTPTSTYTPF